MTENCEHVDTALTPLPTPPVKMSRDAKFNGVLYCTCNVKECEYIPVQELKVRCRKVIKAPQRNAADL
jgi:hypothetical protein